MADKDILEQKVPFNEVRYRQQGGGNVLYMPAEYVFAAMNTAFGNSHWNYDSAPELLYETNVGKDGKDMWVVSYMCKATVETFKDSLQPCVKTDYGVGHGKSKDLGQAHESAIKEAVTDAVKRACRSFGPRVGLYLYFSEGRLEVLLAMVGACDTVEELRELRAADLINESKSPEDYAKFMTALSKRKKEIENA